MIGWLCWSGGRPGSEGVSTASRRAVHYTPLSATNRIDAAFTGFVAELVSVSHSQGVKFQGLCNFHYRFTQSKGVMVVLENRLKGMTPKKYMASTCPCLRLTAGPFCLWCHLCPLGLVPDGYQRDALLWQ
jgi:hypothetical protein